MTNKELNDSLYKKMSEEQDKYKAWLLSQSPEEILNHTVEFSVRGDILMLFEYNELNDEQANALLASPSPLSDVYKNFEKWDFGYMDNLRDCAEDAAMRAVRREQEQAADLKNTPVYYRSAAYARENGELEQYRQSRKANVACAEAIEEAISKHWGGAGLEAAAVREVVDRFGHDRTMFVLANTVNQNQWDERFSPDNRRWAKSIDPTRDAEQLERNRAFSVHSHAVKTDIFINQARRDYLLTQPLTAPEIKEEALRLLRCLQSEREPNSPSGTHFMAELSQDFMFRASAKDMTALQKLLPFKSLALTKIKGSEGVYAVISGDENRGQKLRELRPSVLAKLEKTLPATSPNNSAKSKNLEL